MSAGHPDRPREHRTKIAWHADLIAGRDFRPSGGTGIADADDPFINHNIGKFPAVTEGGTRFADIVGRIEPGSAHRRNRIRSMHLEVGGASGRIDDRAQNSSKEAYLGRRSTTRRRQRVIIDNEVARFAKLQLATIGECDDGTPARPGDDPVSDVYRRPRTGARGSAAAL